MRIFGIPVNQDMFWTTVNDSPRANLKLALSWDIRSNSLSHMVTQLNQVHPMRLTFDVVREYPSEIISPVNLS